MDINQIMLVTDPKELEAIGKKLDTAQFLNLLDHHMFMTTDHWKLGVVLDGLEPQIFLRAISEGSLTQLNALKDEEFIFAVQHQLIGLSHTIQLKIEELFTQLENLEQEITEFDLDNAGFYDLNPLFSKIELFSTDVKNILSIAERALGLAWNTERTDLIESLSTLKEKTQKIKNSVGKNTEPPSGLYANLDNQLKGVYGVPGQPDGLYDNDPAIEGLRKINICFPADFFEIGLITDSKAIEKWYSDKDRHDTERQLLDAVVKKLESIGLFTVKNLKQAGIFSRKSLKEFLSTRQALC